MKDDAQEVEYLGSIDFSNDEFPTLQPFPSPLQKSIMPVVSCRGEEIRTVGTCFAISNQGLVLTARHVIEEGLRPTHAPHQEGEWSLGALYIAEPASPNEVDDPSDLLGGIIPASKMYVSDDLDIGVMHLNLPTNTKTGSRLAMPSQMLSTEIPAVGSICVGFGYHTASWEAVSESRVTHKLLQSFSASRGEVEEIHFPLRDNHLLRWPCFRSTARFEKGMSGGPVIGLNGNVIGVVCSSIESDGDYISYISIAGLSLLLKLESMTEKGIEPRFLYDFFCGGAMRVDSPECFQAMRGDDFVALNFGRDPIFRNVL